MVWEGPGGGGVLYRTGQKDGWEGTQGRARKRGGKNGNGPSGTDLPGASSMEGREGQQGWDRERGRWRKVREGSGAREDRGEVYEAREGREGPWTREDRGEGPGAREGREGPGARESRESPRAREDRGEGLGARKGREGSVAREGRWEGPGSRKGKEGPWARESKEGPGARKNTGYIFCLKQMPKQILVYPCPILKGELRKTGRQSLRKLQLSQIVVLMRGEICESVSFLVQVVEV